ncbi:MAG: hypothetical protein HOB82_05685 [Alphaproteobacteria bacterium]|nr:hypothetical protein [Alphaproteobacteria bacterium]
MPDPRTQRDKILDRARNYRPFDRSRMVKLAHRIAPDDPYPQSRVTQEARQLLHEEESNMLGYKSRNIFRDEDDPSKITPVAWGMYQFRVIAFKEVGMIDADGNWIEGNNYGVTSFDEFLANPLAQEQAMEDFMISQQNQIEDYKTDDFVGESIDVVVNGEIVTISITMDGLLAAAHIEGAGGTNGVIRSFFEGSENSRVFVGEIHDISQRPKGDRNKEKIFNVLKRLLKFQDVTVLAD